MVIGELMEVILYVDDMERAVSFYRGQLGLAIAYPHLDNYRDEYWVVFDTGYCKLCLHAGGTDMQGPSAPKVVFHVDDIHAARATLLARDVVLSDVRTPSIGIHVCDGVDPTGNRFSIESTSQTQ